MIGSTNYVRDFSPDMWGFSYFAGRTENMKTIVYLLIVFLLSLTQHCLAQSDNYWSWNFNTPSTLLAGSVVGGSAGPSAAFYNLALIDHDDIPWKKRKH